ncbi:unnamed protein product [Polarella glacialis]|uniref:Uncharacterized protein n=1 Tax=Polarella glacialis TaxID=89957 RepID=A0A813HR45_POLGL|nr:unnamed protein product [Polarella glacialis]CAE8668140.1 unnamed protein product [Polarella glacialis]
MLLVSISGANLIPLLVEARADPEARVVDGELQLGEEDGEAFPETPLLSAAMANDADACVALLECKALALVDTPGAQRRTALMVAAEFQATAALRLLVERGAYLEAKDVQGCTALVQACETRNDEVANLLRELGADTSAKNLSGTTARDLTKLGTGRAIEIPDSCRWFSSCPTAQAQQVRNVVGARNNTIRWLQP